MLQIPRERKLERGHVCACVIAGLTTGGGAVFIRAAASVDVGYQKCFSVVLSFDAFPKIINLNVKNLLAAWFASTLLVCML